MNGTPTATLSPTRSHPSTSSAPLVETPGLEESSSDSDEEPLQRGGPPHLETYDEYRRLIIEPVGFILGGSWKELLHYWVTDQKFLKYSANAKVVRVSENSGSLHTSRATSQVNVKKKLVYRLLFYALSALRSFFDN
ncbi:hypothetical protein K7X08_029947 [Anisodus acutangulus]|uniref:Uncharacterized protein n=1 Tax=Anisodus acutangulus TaxID=402998 RepID=A0A9Q1LJQ6_9SOLA|nr:hypothetical protein K7X08_029947 [Anisodus acutangulus]